jgi:hypothetical protein
MSHRATLARSVVVFLARGAEAEKLELALHDPVAIGLRDAGSEVRQGAGLHVGCLAALKAVNMAVRGHHAVKSRLLPACYELPRLTGLTENLQIPIDRAQADSRQTLSQAIIQLVGRGVAWHAAKLFERQRPLPSCSQWLTSHNGYYY